MVLNIIRLWILSSGEGAKKRGTAIGPAVGPSIVEDWPNRLHNITADDLLTSVG